MPKPLEEAEDSQPRFRRSAGLQKAFKHMLRLVEEGSVEFTLCLGEMNRYDPRIDRRQRQDGLAVGSDRLFGSSKYQWVQNATDAVHGERHAMVFGRRFSYARACTVGSRLGCSDCCFPKGMVAPRLVLEELHQAKHILKGILDWRTGNRPSLGCDDGTAALGHGSARILDLVSLIDNHALPLMRKECSWLDFLGR